MRVQILLGAPLYKKVLLKKQEESGLIQNRSQNQRKIGIADEIFGINKNGYVGSSIKSEIE